MSKINKEEVISAVSADTKQNITMVSDVVNSLLKFITTALMDGNRVQFAGFGTFEPKIRAPRMGRNPYTNEGFPIPARITPSFKPGNSLKSAVIKNLDK